jgi:hypothetical protein
VQKNFSRRQENAPQEQGDNIYLTLIVIDYDNRASYMMNVSRKQYRKIEKIISER